MPIISQDQESQSNTAYAIDDSDNYYYVLNDVHIIGAYGFVASGSSDDHIINAGSIYGIGIGISLDQSDSMTVSNNNSGIIDGVTGIDMSGLSSGIYNAGLINGTVEAVFLQGGAGRINNIGSITSEADAIALGTGSDYRVNNSGLLSGDQHAISAAAAGDVTVRNTGSIVGVVTFGSGYNIFDGRGGTLNGTIFGGSNADLIHLGNDGETVRGGNGIDIIYAGAGADTIILTHLSKYDVDHIHQFAAGQDTFDLDHASFKALAVGDPVVFASGSKATSTADHLFYNAGTGSLYYDADGSGAKSKATLIAHLDTGLHLTANNFEVV